MAKVTHYGCPAPKAMLGGGDVTGWAVEHAVAKVEGEALARMSGGEHSKQRQVRSLRRVSLVPFVDGYLMTRW